MLIPIERLVDGLVQTLLEHVLPDVGSRYARGQLYAVVDVLRNLCDRIDERPALLEAEATSAESALLSAASSLRTGPGAEAAARIEAALAAAPASPLAERLAALRGAVVLALHAIDDLPPESAEPARVTLSTHLGSQALREVTLLKPSLLAEISGG